MGRPGTRSHTTTHRVQFATWRQSFDTPMPARQGGSAALASSAKAKQARRHDVLDKDHTGQWERRSPPIRVSQSRNLAQDAELRMAFWGRLDK